MVVFFIDLLNHLVILFLIIAFVNINSVEVDCFAELHQHLYVPSLAQSILVYDGVEYFEDPGLRYPLDTRVEIFFLRVEDVDVPIVVLARQKVKRSLLANNMPDELVLLDSWVVFLIPPLEDVVLYPIRKNCHLEII